MVIPDGAIKAILPGVPGEAWHSYPITLDGGVYLVVQTYRERTDSWYLDLYDSAGTLLAGGRRLSPGRFPLHWFGLDIPGEFIVGGTDEFTRYDLGVQGGLTLEYVPGSSLPTGDPTPAPSGYLTDGEPPDPAVGTNGSGVPLDGTILESLTALGIAPDCIWSGDGDNSGANPGDTLTAGLLGEGIDPRDIVNASVTLFPVLRDETAFHGFPYFSFYGGDGAPRSLTSTDHFWDVGAATVIVVFRDVQAADPDEILTYAASYFDYYGGVYIGRGDTVEPSVVVGTSNGDTILGTSDLVPGVPMIAGLAWDNATDTARVIFGNQVDEVELPGDVGSDDEMHIGQGHPTYTYPDPALGLQVAFVAVWTRALTVEEIARVYRLAVYRCALVREDAPAEDPTP